MIADQLPRRVARQAGVGVERDAVADLRQDGQVADLDGGRVRRAAQQAIELLDLAALALPSHPAAFLAIPLPGAVEEIEAVAVPVAVARVERLDAGAAAARIPRPPA